jgi:hypothetical protein
MVGIATIWDVMRDTSWSRRDQYGEAIDDVDALDADVDPDLVAEQKHGGAGDEHFQYVEHPTMVYSAPGTMGNSGSPSSSQHRRMSPMVGGDHSFSHPHPTHNQSTHHIRGHVAHASTVAAMNIHHKYVLLSLQFHCLSFIVASSSI